MWEKSRGTSAWIELRLDQTLVTHQWMEVHNEVTLFNVKVSTSNHTPIFLDVNKNTRTTLIKKFWFENAWLRKSSCKDIVLDFWESNEGLDFNQKNK